MANEFPRRIEDFEFNAFGYPTTRGEFIAQAFIWPVAGAEGESSNFKNLGVFPKEEEAVQMATRYAENWIRNEMLKRRK